MSRKNAILNDEVKWVYVKDQQHFENIKLSFKTRIQGGNYVGGGHYRILRYEQHCPRNCCYDSVVYFMHSKDVEPIIKGEMTKLAERLKDCRGRTERW